MKSLLVIISLFNQAFGEEASLTPIIPNATPIILPNQSNDLNRPEIDQATKKPEINLQNKILVPDTDLIVPPPVEPEAMDDKLDDTNPQLVITDEKPLSTTDLIVPPVEPEKLDDNNQEEKLAISSSNQIVLAEPNLVTAPPVEPVPEINNKKTVDNAILLPDTDLIIPPPLEPEGIEDKLDDTNPQLIITDEIPLSNKDLIVVPAPIETAPKELVEKESDKKTKSALLSPASPMNLEKIEVIPERKPELPKIKIDTNKVIPKKVEQKTVKKVPLPITEDITIEEIILDTEIQSNPNKRGKTVTLPVRKKLPDSFYQSEYTSLLFSAVKNDDLVGMKSLITKGANINAQEVNNGYTLPLYAVKFNRIKGLRYLILQGVDLSRVNLEGQTALHLAAKLGNIEAMEVLLAAGLDPTTKDKSGLRAADYMKKSMKASALVMAQNYRDMNKALIDFTGLGSLEAVEYALQKGAAIDFLDDIGSEGDTALMIAIKSQDIPMISLLLNNAASLNIKNKKHQSPLEIAILTGNQEILAILKTVQINRELVGSN